MVSYSTIVLFFLYCWGLGCTASALLPKPEHRGERFFLQVGLGLGLLPLLLIFLNFVHLPIDWKLVLALSLAYPFFMLLKTIRHRNFTLSFSLKSFPPVGKKMTKTGLLLLGAILISAISLYMYAQGAFNYPYLEDEDPWGHAVGAKYVALEKTAYDPEFKAEGRMDSVLSYIDPYPPAYDALMGILHQTSPSLPWTLKFFNALIISLSLIFFYLFAQELMGNRAAALLATFFLAAIPAYFSHFIWAHSLTIAIFFPAMYCLIKIKQEPKWWYLAAFIFGSIWVSQNLEQPMKLTILALLFAGAYSITYQRFFRREFSAILTGMLLSLLWWGTMLAKYGKNKLLEYYGAASVAASSEAVPLEVVSEGSSSLVSIVVDKAVVIIHKLTSAGGSGSRSYLLDDFVFAQKENMINAPIGIGLLLSILTLIAVVYFLFHLKKNLVKKENSWKALVILWLLILFWGVNGQTFPIPILRAPFRIWLLLGIPVALLAAEGARLVAGWARKISLPPIVAIFFIIVGVIFTSAIPKMQTNLSVWPTSGSFSSPQEPWDYAALFEQLPANAPVFLYAPRDKLTIGYGGYACAWCEEQLEFRNKIIHRDAEELFNFLKSKGYEFLVINGNMDSKYFRKSFGENVTATLLPQRYNEILSSSHFTPIAKKDNFFVVFKVNL